MTDQTSSPLVSVIIPTRNRAQLLTRALKSVLAQTYSHFEIIIIDDASTDTTPDAVRSQKDPRILYVRQEVVRGPGGARNVGIQAAQGELVAFLDDDDEYFTDKLKMQVRAMMESLASVGFVYSPVRTIRDGQPIDLFPSFEASGNIFLQYLSSFPFPLNAALIRKQHAALFDEKLSCLEDVDFFLKVLQNVKAVFSPGVCGICHVDSRRKRLSESLAPLHSSFRALEGRYFNDPADSFLVHAHADVLLHFAYRLFALGYKDEAARNYIERAFAVRKDKRTMFFKFLNSVGPGLLTMFKPHHGS